MPSLLSEFDIDFVKLKEGVHEFQYRIGKPFFDAFENSEVLHANVEARISLDKQHQMMQADLQMTGTVGVTCDRCLETLNMPVDTQYRLIYKTQEEAGREPQGEVELVFIAPQEFTINVAQPIYESVLLAVPMIRNCDGLENKPCNREMLEKLDKLKQTGEGESDPRWDKLKDLLK